MVGHRIVNLFKEVVVMKKVILSANDIKARDKRRGKKAAEQMYKTHKSLMEGLLKENLEK